MQVPCKHIHGESRWGRSQGCIGLNNIMALGTIHVGTISQWILFGELHENLSQNNSLGDGEGSNLANKSHFGM